MKKSPRIVPHTENVCTGRDLAAALAKTKLSDEEARAWNKDLREARESLKPKEEKRT